MKKLKKILLIDDNEMINFYNEDVVAETELFEQIEIVDNGTEALEYLRTAIEMKENLPELILLDIKMPDYDGFEILEEFEDLINSLPEKSEYAFKARKTVVCILTTSQHSRDMESFQKYEMAREYIEKPLSKEKIFDVVNKYLS